MVEKVAVLERMLDIARDEEKLNEKIGRVNDEAESLATSAEGLASVSTSAHELARASRYPPASAVERAGMLAEQIVLRRAAVSDNATSLIDADFSDLTGECETFTREATAWAQLAWAEVRDGVEMPAVDQDLLDQLERAGLDVEEVRGPVESAEADLLLLRSRRIPVEGDLQRLIGATAKRREAVTSLQQLLSPAVARFIVSASKPSGAELALLTDEVLAFLKDKDIELRYRIRLV
jgi:hypothetical protein